MIRALLPKTLALAIDGDAIWCAREGEKSIHRHPAVVAQATQSERVLAVGDEALRMVGNEPQNIRTLRLCDPQIMLRHPEMVEQALRYVLHKSGSRGLFGPRVVLAPPLTMPGIWKQALTEAGAREVILIEPTLPAAIGAGLRIEAPEPRAVMVLDRHHLWFGVVSLAGVMVGFEAHFGVGRILEDVVLSVMATRNVALDPDRLHDEFCRTGLQGQEAIGWEAWLSEVATGPVSATSLTGTDFQRWSLPFQHLLAWHHRHAFATLDPRKRIAAESAPLWLVGRYAALPGVAEAVGSALNRRAYVPEHPEESVIRGVRELLADLRFVIRFATQPRPA